MCEWVDVFLQFLNDVAGVDYRTHAKMLAEEKPQIVVGTPGRVWDLINRGDLKVDKLSHFVLDECDKLLDQLGE